MNKQFHLIDLLRVLPTGGVVVEVGVFRGGFSSHLYQELKPEKLILIDTWDDLGDYNGEESYNIVKEKFKDCPNVTLLRGYSSDLIPTLEDKSISIAYVDGDHRYEGALSDLEQMLPKMKSGGWLCGHDYCPNDDYGVVRAVAVFCDRHNLNIDLMTNEPPEFCHGLMMTFHSFGIRIP